jgi:hypothetical protein
MFSKRRRKEGSRRRERRMRVIVGRKEERGSVGWGGMFQEKGEKEQEVVEMAGTDW